MGRDYLLEANRKFPFKPTKNYLEVSIQYSIVSNLHNRKNIELRIN